MIADVVVGRAERVGLGEVAEQEAGDEGHWRQQPVRVPFAEDPPLNAVSSEGQLTRKAKGPVSGAFPVAGAGFEPATSGL